MNHFTIEDKIVFDYFPYTFNKLNRIPWLHFQDTYSTLDSNIKKSGAGYFYYHIENDAGYLDEYLVLSVYEKNILRIRKERKHRKNVSISLQRNFKNNNSRMRIVPKHSILFILIISCTSIAAQTVLIKQTVPENFEDIDEGHGPNRAHFSYPYFALGMHTDGYSHENDTIISPVYGRSMEMRFGTRTRLKLNRFLGFGIDYELGIPRIL